MPCGSAQAIIVEFDHDLAPLDGQRMHLGPVAQQGGGHVKRLAILINHHAQVNEGAAPPEFSASSTTASG